MNALGWNTCLSEITTLLPVMTSRRNVPSGYGDNGHLWYLKQYRKTVYADLLTNGKLNGYLADLNEQAEDMFSRLVKELAQKDSITETLKTENQILWVRRMNTVKKAAAEIVNNDLIYA